MTASPTPLLLASFAAVVALPWFVGVSDALAQTPAPALTPYPTCTIKPTAQDSEAAHSAYLLGKRFFDESDYGSASHNFIDAYKLDCTKPELLLNIARANELLGNRAESVHALETYMQRSQSLTPDERSQYQRRIDNLKAAIAAQAAPTTPVVTATPVTTATPATVAPPAPSTLPAPPPPASPPSESQHGIAPWILVGVGGAAAIAGGVIYLVGAGDISDAKTVCNLPGPNTCPGTAAGQAAASKGSTGNSLETVGGVTFYTGLAAAAGGVIWHFLEPSGPATKPDAPKASLTPNVGPGYAGASVVGTF
jgi:hypothetical protein